MRVIMLRIVLSQEILAVIIAIGRAHHGVDVVARGRIVVVDDARLVVKLDEDHRVEHPIVEGTSVVERANPSETRLAQVTFRFGIADLGVVGAYTAGIGAQQRFETLPAFWRQLFIANSGGIYPPVIIEGAGKQFRGEVLSD